MTEQSPEIERSGHENDEVQSVLSASQNGSALPFLPTMVELHNFRRFKHLRRNISPFLLLYGKNGAGKTSLLDGLMFPLACAVERFGGSNLGKSMWLRPDDVRIDPATQTRSFPLECFLYGEVLGGPTLSMRARSDGDIGHWLPGDAIVEAAALKLHELSSSMQMLPLIARFAADRSFRRPDHSKGNWPNELQKPALRLDGYRDCFDAGRDADRFVSFFAKQALIETKRSSVPLKAVLSSIRHFLPRFVDASFDPDKGDVFFNLGDGAPMAFHSLSDGQRGFLGIVTDLAIRSVQLNPQLGERAPLETPGLVTIDELDLHLHPAWQRDIVKGLRSAFPKVTFVTSTHSPVILSEVPVEQVFDLGAFDLDTYARKTTERDEDEVGSGIPSTYGKPAGWLLENVMGASDRPLLVDELIAEVESKLHDRLIDESEKALDRLRGLVDTDDPILQGLEWELTDLKLDAAQN